MTKVATKVGKSTYGLFKPKDSVINEPTNSSNNSNNSQNRDGTQGSENKSVHSNPSDEIKSSRENLSKYTKEFEEVSKKRVNLKNNYTKATW